MGRRAEHTRERHNTQLEPMSAADDLNALVTGQRRELMAAMYADSDLDLAFRLQMEEAMVASLSTLPPSDRPSSSAAPATASPSPYSSSTPIPPVRADWGGDDANQSLSHAIYLQDLELERYQLEKRDREQSLAEVRMAVEDIRRQAHDERFAREVLEMPDEEWEDYGDEFELPIEAAGVADDLNFRLFFKGLSSQQVSEGVPIELAVIAVDICDSKGTSVLKIQKPVETSALGTCREVLEGTALIEGLNAVISLGIKRIFVFFDYMSLYNHVKGIWRPRREKISNVTKKVQALMGKFEFCKLILLPRCHIKHVFRLARDAIDSEISKNALDLVDLKFPRETCNICLEVLDSSEMFSIETCLHRFCFVCMKQHVEIKLLHGILPACPHDGCKVMIDIEGARKFLPPRLLELMSQHLKEASIPTTERVYCPYPKCSALMSKGEAIYPQQGSSSKRFFFDSGLRKCIKCNRSFCINCKVPWHETLLCSEFKRLNPNLQPEEAKLKSLAKKNLWRQCVKCNHMIELSEGCFHMTCRCGYEFCYTCGAEWKNKNPTCKCPLFEYGTEDGDDEETIYDEDEDEEYYDDDYDSDVDQDHYPPQFYG